MTFSRTPPGVLPTEVHSLKSMRYPNAPASPQALEEETLEHWRNEKLFQRTLAATSDGEPFVFYEGPPTANGRPGLHHIISRTIKDLICRHRTMQGRSVTRIAGWDTHGLPVEIEAEKALGISGKPDIERLGIAEFNRICRESVFRYKEDWEKLSERIGYWLDYSDPYVTFHTEYIESVWAILKRMADAGYLYRGHRSVPYCPRCGTALSSHEVAQGYEEVQDPSLYFLCDWVDGEENPDPERRSFLAWTTTPWTVPANTALAVKNDLAYAEVEWEGRRLVLAEARVAALFGEDAEIRRRYAGTELEGVRYRRPLDLVEVPEAERESAWRVVLEDFVTAEDGSGLVHLAPAFGADDFAAGQRHGFPLLRPVDDRGCFLEGIPLVGGKFVKDADPILVEELGRVGALFQAGEMTHSYPHCWRCRSPLLYMARDSWFIATSTRKEAMLENNAQVNWHPPELGTGRFGEWLANNVDWALSRDRYWGTPLPAWVCDRDPDTVEWIGSVAELAGRAGGLPDGFDPHRPYIDEVTWPCECGGTMRRESSVLDAWFDSGSMPYAQWHWPHENEEEFRSHFPADFICEGLDQTRGWFYSLTAIATLLDLGPAYRNVIVNGLILDADGQKMSKSRGNTVDPWDAIGEFGADALRWYLVTVSNPWVAKRYDPDGVGEAARKFFDTMLNSYRFFALYANAEEWAPSERDPEPASRPVLDRWLLSRLNSLQSEVGAELDGYQITRAYRLVSDFVNEDLSNWYVRRSRPRFWGNTDPDDATAAFRTLWEALVAVARLTAPITPFFSDWIHRAMAGGASVHLAPFPEADETQVDRALEAEMAAVRALVSLGRAAREEVRIRVRQPLRTLRAVVPNGVRPRAEVLEVLREELNVKEITFLDSTDTLTTLSARPDFRVLGPRFQRASQEAENAIRALASEALAALRMGEPVMLMVAGDAVPLEMEWLEIVESASGDYVVKSEEGYTAALDPTLDDELRIEGMARELVNRIQRLRKDAGLEITDRIRLGIEGGPPVQEAVHAFSEFVTGETLATSLEVGARGSLAGFAAHLEDDVDGTPIRVLLSRDG